MSMSVAEGHFEAPRQASGFHFAFVVLATALVTLAVIPALALAISYLAGGAATSTILFVYLFAVLTNGPFLSAALLLTLGVVAAPLVSRLYHAHA